MNVRASVRASIRGFSLLELLIATAIIALLATLAVPAFQSQATTAHRAAAKLHLTDLMSAQHRHRLRHQTYALDLGELADADADDEHYAYAAHKCPPGIKLCVRLVATAQSGDDTLTLESNGRRLPPGAW